MNNLTARAVRGTAQFVFHSLLMACFFLVPSILEGLIFGATV